MMQYCKLPNIDKRETSTACSATEQKLEVSLLQNLAVEKLNSQIRLQLRLSHPSRMIIMVYNLFILLQTSKPRVIIKAFKSGLEFFCACSCNYILSTKLPWPVDNEEILRSLSQAATCPLTTYSPNMVKASYCSLTAERQVGKL